MFHSAISSPDSGNVSLTELVAAFSYALDITEGQPAGHSIRSCWIGLNLGRAIGLSDVELAELGYSILLKDLGCSSNAARICELYQADDRAFKQGYKTVGTGLAATLVFIFSKTARSAPLHRRAAAIGNILANGSEFASELILARCTRGADIARLLRFSERVSEGIYRLDEHWDGSGRPGGLRGNAIPLESRIALLAQIVDVFHSHAGREAALDEVRRRSGSWLDPALVAAMDSFSENMPFWETLRSPFVEARTIRFLPPAHDMPVDHEYLDTIAMAFGQVIDAKSPFTAGHSQRVADLVESLSATLGLSEKRRPRLRRAGFLHDVGKLGVSNAILDKPGSLDDREWQEMRTHSDHTRAILGRIGALSDLADIAAAHHERIDGRGYPKGLRDQEIALETRIITVCDFYDALISDRPYRSAMPVEEALAVMRPEVGGAIDADCFNALENILASAPIDLGQAK